MTALRVSRATISREAYEKFASLFTFLRSSLENQVSKLSNWFVFAIERELPKNRSKDLKPEILIWKTMHRSDVSRKFELMAS